MRLVFILLILTITISSESSVLHDVANDSANIVTKILGSFQGTSSMNLTQFFSSFNMPSCLRRCMPAMDNVGILLDNAKKPETMKAMCQNLTEASKCATSAGCDGTFVGAISNAFQFVCLDNLEKVSSQIACIQENAGSLQQDCETECSVQADMIDKAAKNNADQLFNMDKICNSTTCIATCYQNNLPNYCEIGEDNVIDAIFSQFESLQEQSPFGYLQKNKQNKTGIEKLLGMMMPEECNSEKMKIKIPKKIDITKKPKSVGSPPEVPKDISGQKNTAERSLKNTTEYEDNATLLAKSGNLSSAAIMIDGKIQTLQCQFLDTRGNPQNTPDFETLSTILSEHFNKKAPTTTHKPVADEKGKKELCLEATSDEPQYRNSGSMTIVSMVFGIVILFYL